MAVTVNVNNEETRFTKTLQGLLDGIYQFQYVKKTTGEVRIARGTLNTDFVEDSVSEKNQALFDEENFINIIDLDLDQAFLYYDVDKGHIRSFIPNNLL